MKRRPPREPELPPELAPEVARLHRRAEEQARLLARMRTDLDEARTEVEHLRRALKETELRRVAEVGAIKHDIEEERGKSAALREKLVKAENEKRAAARDVLDAKLSTSTQEAERKTLERELLGLRVEVDRLRAQGPAAKNEP